MKLIDKDALVAEIEKLMDELYDKLPNASKVENGTVTASEICNTGKYTALELFRNYIDTLEVKEVDLEKKATQLSQEYFPDEENVWARPNIEAQRCKSACIEMVEWLKAQKGE